MSPALLDRADAVERERGGADERAAGLEDEARRRESPRRPFARDRTRDGAHELLHRRFRLVLDVADPEAAADVDERRCPVELVAAARRELSELRDRLQVRAAVRELGADVHVQAFDLEPGRACGGDRDERLVGVEAELRAAMPGPDRFVCLGFDARRDADEHPADARLGGARRLVERVERDERAGLGRGAQLLVGFVVPVHDEPVALDPRPPRKRELAERRHVGAEAFLREQPHHGDVRERLRPVDDERVGDGPTEHPRPLPQRSFGVDDERCSESLGELRRCEPVELQDAALDPRAGGEELDHPSRSETVTSS